MICVFISIFFSIVLSVVTTPLFMFLAFISDEGNALQLRTWFDGENCKILVLYAIWGMALGVIPGRATYKSCGGKVVATLIALAWPRINSLSYYGRSSSPLWPARGRGRGNGWER